MMTVLKKCHMKMQFYRNSATCSLCIQYCDVAFQELWNQLLSRLVLLRYLYGVGTRCCVGFNSVFTVLLVLMWCYFHIFLSSVCLLYY